MILESVPVGAYHANCYILARQAGSGAIIIDPGDEEDKIRKMLNKHKLKPAFIVNTHGHADHIGCDDKFGVPVYVHEKDLALLSSPQLNMSDFLGSSYRVKSQIKTVKEGSLLESDGIQLEVIHLPGHTPGGMALLMKKPQNKILFTGDSLFRMTIGRADFPGADQDILIRSIKEKLFELPDDTVIYPGHGPTSTIGEEKKNNPFLN
ncbi:MAG: MBL fold metallo-hydrolase [Candidatus Omnitrophica bacterium]|nr:MBL fold metallo-hydrolase [Candidatus Omnitrophota bacterium]